MDIFIVAVIASLLLVLGLLATTVRSLWGHEVVGALRYGGLMFITLGLLSTIVFYHDWTNSLVLNGTGAWAHLPHWFLVLPYIFGVILLFFAGAILMVRYGRQWLQARLDRAALAPEEQLAARGTEGSPAA